jgi:hypothetical protein
MTTYVAYVYPGWHWDTHRPAVDEWQVLANAAPYFPGHPSLARPLNGEYDDTLPETARAQIRLAKDSGLCVFDYFSYYTEDGFVMNRPLDVAVGVLDGDPDFAFAMTWCIRLPHDQLPVGPVPALGPSGPEAETGAGLTPPEVDRLRADEVPVAVLERLLATADDEKAPVR